jgi:uncharacterized protein YhhL (DUF1145 family)
LAAERGPTRVCGVSESGTPAKTTLGAVVLILIVTAPFLFNAVSLARSTTDEAALRLEVREALILNNVNPGEREAANYARYLSIIMLAICLVTIAIAVGMLRRREGAHHAGIVVFGVLAVVSIAASLAGLNSDPPAPRAGLGLATGIGNALIVFLLLRRTTMDDIERAESLRARARWDKEERRRQRRAARS